MSTEMQHSANIRGFGLIEVLISLLVVSVGLLSMVGLQVLSKRANYEAVQRTTGAHLAYDLFERMRANNDRLNDYTTQRNRPLGGGSLGNAPPVDCRAVAAPCDSREMAQFDLWEWERTLDGMREIAGATGTGGLVAPTACINGPPGGQSGIYTIAIAWRGTNALTNPATDPCGAGSGKYGAGDAFRRVLATQTFIARN